LEITKTVLSLMLVMITILTTLTTIAAVYAGEGGNDDEDGNKQKSEDDSAAAIADCDDNDVERAGFDCIAIATNDVEIVPAEERATLSVCKEVGTTTLAPEDFTFTVTGNNPSPAQFQGDNADGCVDVTIGPGEYTVTEAAAFTNFATRIQEGSDCVQDPIDLFSRRATGEIQAGETQECIFFNFRD
jgi:hypothetical protein